MKLNQATASSSARSSTTTATMEERDSCYYPGCRKDANCNCDICLASINATLDLMSVNRSSLAKFSSSRPNIERTPLSFSPSILSTPISNSCPRMESPLLKSTARLNLSDIRKKKKRNWGYVGAFSRLVLGLSLLFIAETGFSRGLCGVLRPALSPDIVRKIGARSRFVQDLTGSLRFMENELKRFVADGKVSNCSHMHSIWKMDQVRIPRILTCTKFHAFYIRFSLGICH